MVHSIRTSNLDSPRIERIALLRSLTLQSLIFFFDSILRVRGLPTLAGEVPEQKNVERLDELRFFQVSSERTRPKRR